MIDGGFIAGSTVVCLEFNYYFIACFRTGDIQDCIISIETDNRGDKQEILGTRSADFHQISSGS